MNVPLLAGPAVDRFDFVQMAGPLARGTNILCVAPRWQDIGPNQEFVDAFQSLAGRPPSSQAILAYDATNVLLATIRETASVGHLSREEVLGRIRSVRNLSGLTGPLEFDEQGERLEPPIWVRPVNSSQ
jgi:ABC-type branched-subunit amino acid transport system substrate-binding protein